MRKVCMMVTNPVTNDARVINEATSLTLNGHEVTILATKNGDTAPEECIKGFKIKRLSRTMKQNTLLGKIEFIFKFTAEAVRQKADVYHAHDLSTLLECYLAAKLRHAKIIYDSHELFVGPEKHGFGYWLYSQIEKLLIGRVDAVITVNSYIARFIEEYYHLKNNIFVVMNCPPMKQDIWSDNTNNSKYLVELRSVKQKNMKIILYQGIIYEERCLKELVEAMNFLPESYCLFIIGEGDFLPELKNLTRSSGLGNRVYFTGLVSLEDLSEYTKLADVGVNLVSKEKGLSFYYSSPNKLFQYIHAGLPIVTLNYPFYKEVFDNYDIGCLIESSEPVNIANAIKSVLENKPRYSKMKANTILAKERFNWEIESTVLLEVYREIDTNNCK